MTAGLRVAIVSEVFLPKTDGVVHTVRQMLDGLARRTIATLLVAPAGTVASYGETAIVHAPGVPVPAYPGLRACWADSRVITAIDRFAPDLIHVAGPTLLAAGVIRWARSRGISLVSTYHTNLPDYLAHYRLGRLRPVLWRWLRTLHNACARTLCPSATTLAALRAERFANLGVWSRGIDPVLFRPAHRSATVRDELAAGRPDLPLLIYVGRLADEKRIDRIADALPGLPVRLAIVGDGPARARLERRFAGLPVVFTGFRHGRDLAAAYASADLFVFPSTTETFGNVVLEAMASGLPVVAAAAGGSLDLVQDGRTGILVPPDDAAALARAINRLITQPAQRAAFGRSARQAAIRYTWPRRIDQLVAEYDAVLGRVPATRAAVLA